VGPILHVRAMFPVQTASACPPLSSVSGSPGSEYDGRICRPHGPRPSFRSGLPGTRTPETVRASQVLDASLHAYHALGGPRQTLGKLTQTLPWCRLLVRSTHRRLDEPRSRGCLTLQGMRSPLRSTWCPVYASPVSFGFTSFTDATLGTGGWLGLTRWGTFTPQATPSFAWRTNAHA
jgi:hypothetical protein